MNIGAELEPLEARKVARMKKKVKPILTEYVDVVSGILDKTRYKKFAVAEWDHDTSRRVRALIKGDATWRAANTEYYPRLRGAVHGLLRSALQVGALDLIDVFKAAIEDNGNAIVSWTLPRGQLTEIGQILVGGYTAQEHARNIWDAFRKSVEAAFRREVRRAKSMGALKTGLKRSMGKAVETAMNSFEAVSGDAYSDGARAALALAEAPRLRVRTRGQ